jgi:hypothetical protein
VQGVHQGYCNFILHAQEERALSSQEGTRKSIEGHRGIENLKGFKPSKFAEEFAQDSARSAEEGREQSKSQEEIVLSVQEGQGLAKAPKTVKLSIVGRRQVVEDREI